MKVLLLDWWQGNQLAVTPGYHVLAVDVSRPGEPYQFVVERSARLIDFLERDLLEQRFYTTVNDNLARAQRAGFLMR